MPEFKTMNGLDIKMTEMSDDVIHIRFHVHKDEGEKEPTVIVFLPLKELIDKNFDEPICFIQEDCIGTMVNAYFKGIMRNEIRLEMGWAEFVGWIEQNTNFKVIKENHTDYIDVEYSIIAVNKYNLEFYEIF